jgi:hypothetical protein
MLIKLIHILKIIYIFLHFRENKLETADLEKFLINFERVDA